jgi:hypothetical protein
MGSFPRPPYPADIQREACLVVVPVALRGRVDVADALGVPVGVGLQVPVGPGCYGDLCASVKKGKRRTGDIVRCKNDRGAGGMQFGSQFPFCRVRDAYFFLIRHSSLRLSTPNHIPSGTTKVNVIGRA